MGIGAGLAVSAKGIGVGFTGVVHRELHPFRKADQRLKPGLWNPLKPLRFRTQWIHPSKAKTCCCNPRPVTTKIHHTTHETTKKNDSATPSLEANDAKNQAMSSNSLPLVSRMKNNTKKKEMAAALA